MDLMMETGLVPETLVSYDRLKRLIVREDLVLIAVKASSHITWILFLCDDTAYVWAVLPTFRRLIFNLKMHSSSVR
jgi:hypothetical protein